MAETSPTPGFWTRKRLTLLVAGLLLAGFLAFNAVAFMQAWAMTHFTTGSDKTESPEELSLGAKVKVLFTGVSVPRPENSTDPSSIGLEFEKVTFSGALDSTLEAWWIPVENSRTTVILLHGYASAKESVLPEAKVLHSLGCSPLLVDFHGSGGSSGNTTSIGYHEAEDVAAAVSWARAKAPESRLVLYGISLGAAATLRAVAKLEVEPDGLILQSCFDRMFTTAAHRFEAMGLPAFPAAHILMFWGGTQHEFNAFAHNPVDYAQNVTCPTLLLHGEKDPRVHVEEFENLTNALGTSVTKVVFEGMGHQSFAKGKPEEFLEVVKAFVEGGEI